MYIIGLTGGSGCGKSTAAVVFTKRGIPVLSADEIYREITSYRSECCIELESEFGPVLTPDGALDRRAAFEMIFKGEGSADRVARLNQITHKYVIRAFEEAASKLAGGGSHCIVFDAPLLIECGYHLKCDLVISVLADRAVRIDRLAHRDLLDRESICARLDAQKKDVFYISASDCIIYNNGDVDSFVNRINGLIDKIEILSKL